MSGQKLLIGFFLINYFMNLNDIIFTAGIVSVIGSPVIYVQKTKDKKYYYGKLIIQSRDDQIVEYLHDIWGGSIQPNAFNGSNILVLSNGDSKYLIANCLPYMVGRKKRSFKLLMEFLANPNKVRGREYKERLEILRKIEAHIY